MLLLATAEAQGQQPRVVGVAGMDHGGAAPTKTHGARIAAVGDFDISGQLTAEQAKLVTRDAGSELKCRSTDGLAIGAVANPHQRGVDHSRPGDVTSKAGATDIHRLAQASEHFVGEQLQYDGILYT